MLTSECYSRSNYSISSRSVYHFAIGLPCRLRASSHPLAIAYHGSECKIVAVRMMRSSEPMLVVEFPDGSHIKGLFFYELEDLEGNQLFREVFNRLHQANKMAQEELLYQFL